MTGYEEMDVLSSDCKVCDPAYCHISKRDYER